MGLISIWPVVENGIGGYLEDSDKKSFWDAYTLAN
jgi:hypothetical protein